MPVVAAAALSSSADAMHRSTQQLEECSTAGEVARFEHNLKCHGRGRILQPQLERILLSVCCAVYPAVQPLPKEQQAAWLLTSTTGLHEARSSGSTCSCCRRLRWTRAAAHAHLLLPHQHGLWLVPQLAHQQREHHIGCQPKPAPVHTWQGHMTRGHDWGPSDQNDTAGEAAALTRSTSSQWSPPMFWPAASARLRRAWLLPGDLLPCHSSRAQRERSRSDSTHLALQLRPLTRFCTAAGDICSR